MDNHTKKRSGLEEDSSELIASGALCGSMADFAEPRGKNFEERARSYYDWQANRRKRRVWPFVNAIHRAPKAEIQVANADGAIRSGLNFASQDYLALAADERVRAAAIEAIRTFGPHSASAPVLQGNTPLSLRLERSLALALQMEHVLLYPTGWAAGFGVITGLVRKDDHVVLDQYAHNCCIRGALAATSNVHRVRHLSTDGFIKQLRRIRSTDNENAILVVTESIFSMDADSPDLRTLQETCEEYEATLLVDIAHDFGSCGPDGTGILGIQNMIGKVDLLVGSFSKVFAANGGFVATRSAAIREYLRPYSPSHTFSNAISPVQCATALVCLEIVRSQEGDALRSQLLRAATTLRNAMGQDGIKCLGNPGPLVPVLLGPEAIGRITASLCFDSGLFANLVEFPAVSVGASRFRMQLMASHTDEQVHRAASIIGRSYRSAMQIIEQQTSK